MKSAAATALPNIVHLLATKTALPLNFCLLRQRPRLYLAWPFDQIRLHTAIDERLLVNLACGGVELQLGLLPSRVMCAPVELWGCTCARQRFGSHKIEPTRQTASAALLVKKLRCMLHSGIARKRNRTAHTAKKKARECSDVRHIENRRKRATDSCGNDTIVESVVICRSGTADVIPSTIRKLRPSLIAGQELSWSD